MADAQLSEHESILPASDRGHAIGYLALLTLAGPASDVITGRAKPTWLAALALAAFVVCYAFAIETGQHWRGGWREVSRRRREVHYVAVAALGPIATVAALSFGANWLVLFIFVAVTAVLTVPNDWAPRADAAVGVVALAVELTHGWTIDQPRHRRRLGPGRRRDRLRRTADEATYRAHPRAARRAGRDRPTGGG